MIRAACVCLLVLACATEARAQTRQAAPRPKRFMLAGGVVYDGGYSVGDAAGNLRRNSTTDTSPFALFRAASAIGAAAGVEGKISFAVTRTIGFEVAGTFSRPFLQVTVRDDAEAATGTRIQDRLMQYGVSLSAVYQVPGVRATSRLKPYVMGGGGYLRQLHEGRLRLDDGRTLHAGAGVRYLLRGAPNVRQRPLGARGELRIVQRSGGIDYEDRSRTYPSASASFFFGF
jgi:opacity protein-like surface antigen